MIPLLIVVAALVALTSFWVLSRVLWSFVARLEVRLERRRLERTGSAAGDAHLRFQILIGVAATAAFSPFTPMVPLPPEAQIAILILGILLWIGSWVIHAIPGHSRVAKYLAMLLASGGTSELANVLRPETSPTTFTLAWAAWMSLATIVALIYAIVRLGVLRPLSPADRSVRRTRRWYWHVMWLQGPDLRSIVGWIAIVSSGLGPAYLLLRFCVRARMSQRPFLYLRSFSSPEAALIFSNVIMPALHRWGVVSGLVHAKQTSGALHREVPVLWRAAFEHVPDDRWRSWVRARLERCEGVIIDVSVESQSVHWELETATQILGAGRVMILSPDPAHSEAETAARVATWASTVLDSVTGNGGGARRRARSRFTDFLHRPVTPVTKRRHQFSAGILSIIPALAIGAAVLSVMMHALQVWYVRDVEEIQRSAEWGGVRSAEQFARMKLSQLDRCPRDPQDLLSPFSEPDSWGQAYIVLCGSAAPPEALGLGVVSLGPDGKLGTKDDVQSWSPDPLGERGRTRTGPAGDLPDASRISPMH